MSHHDYDATMKAIFQEDAEALVPLLLPETRFLGVEDDASLLLEAIDEIIQYCSKDKAQLARPLLWFSVFLHRTDTVSEQEKKKVEERMDAFQQLLEADPFVRSVEARGEARGEAEGELKGVAKGLQLLLGQRFPELEREMYTQILQTQQTDLLEAAIKQISIAPMKKPPVSFYKHCCRKRNKKRGDACNNKHRLFYEKLLTLP